MKVNLGLVKQFTDVTLGTNELVAKVNAQLGVVEEIIDIAEKYKDAVIVRVMSCEKHANADKLSVCMVDAGQKELVKVVCGAPNVHADMWAIWLPPASVVPASFGDDKPFVLDAREIRGEMSHGMLAAADELAIGTDHSGIIELTNADLAPLSKVTALKAGQKFAEVFGLNEVTIDIENKMFTHRPDLFGQLGVAREIAGIQQHQFDSPTWYSTKSLSHVVAAKALPLAVKNDAKKVVPRFVTVVMDEVKVMPSPMWLQAALVSMGSKPINNVVDVTNYVMLMTAQPTHAYDYETLQDAEISARMAKKGESVKLINGKTYQLSSEDIIIADGKNPIGLAGIMGGMDTEVSDKTTRIVLEVANFDMYTVRKSSMNHGLFTDALSRFNKGQSPFQNDVVMNYLIALMTDICGANLVSDVVDESAKLERLTSVKTSASFINQRLGSSLSVKEMSTLLKNVEITVKVNGDTLIIDPPFWRTDIELPEDVVEEIGRLYGFDKLPLDVPLRPTDAAAKNPAIETKQFVRSTMKRLGANELLTYSFVHENVMKRAEQPVDGAYKIYNALSPELQFYRLSVLPSLLDKVHMNIKAGHDAFVLYEIGKGHNKTIALDDESLPPEQQFVDIVYACKKQTAGTGFYVVRQYVEQLIETFGVKIVYKKIDTPLNDYVTAPFDQSRSALVETDDGMFVGILGELKPSVIKNFKLPNTCAAASIDFVMLQKLYETKSTPYKPLSRFPSITQDLSLKVATTVSYQSLFELVNKVALMTGKDIQITVSPRTIYMSENDTSYKTITFRLVATSHERTLTDKDVTRILVQIEKQAAQELQAERI
jgi:phenylalanyl-tRNA synthetase beta chain